MPLPLSSAYFWEYSNDYFSLFKDLIPTQHNLLATFQASMLDKERFRALIVEEENGQDRTTPTMTTS